MTEVTDVPVTASAFSTDLYQLTMMAGYFSEQRAETRATFELFVRRLPPHRRYFVAAGLEPALEYIEQLRFSNDDVRWLRGLPQFAAIDERFFDYLRGFRFTGDVWAMREGTPFFPNEPIVRVTAPLPEAQLLETALLAIVNFQTSIASKAARVVGAAAGRPVMEFGARRAHGTEAALYAARAAYLCGVSATSYVEAGRRFGIPLSGTMAHSWILAAPSELEAFESYETLFGSHTTLLLDTYDVVAAARLVVASGMRPPAVRLDSGDLGALARTVRDIFDAAGLADSRIIVSGDLDEWKIRDLVASGAPIDGYAVGTALTTSDDAPALGGVYKVVELEEGHGFRGVMKRSPGKGTWPGRKQVWRVMREGRSAGDVIGLDDEQPPEAAIQLLEPVMRAGRRLPERPSLISAREYCREAIASMPPPLRELDGNGTYEVAQSERIRALVNREPAVSDRESR